MPSCCCVGGPAHALLGSSARSKQNQKSQESNKAVHTESHQDRTKKDNVEPPTGSQDQIRDSLAVAPTQVGNTEVKPVPEVLEVRLVELQRTLEAAVASKKVLPGPTLGSLLGAEEKVVEEASVRCEQLNQRVTRLDEQSPQKGQEMALQLKDMEERLREHVQQADVKEKESQRYQAEAAGLNQRLQDAQAELGELRMRLQTQTETSELRMQTLQRQIQEHAQEQNDSRQKHSQLTQRVAEVNALLTARDTQISELTQTLDQKEVAAQLHEVRVQEHKQLTERLAELTGLLGARDNQISELTQLLDQKQVAAQLHEARLQEMMASQAPQPSVQHLERQLKDQALQINMHLQAEETHAKERERLTQRVAELTGACVLKDKDISDLQAEAKDNAGKQQEYTLQAQRVAEMMESLDARDKQIAELTETLSQKEASPQEVLTVKVATLAEPSSPASPISYEGLGDAGSPLSASSRDHPMRPSRTSRVGTEMAALHSRLAAAEARFRQEEAKKKDLEKEVEKLRKERPAPRRSSVHRASPDSLARTPQEPIARTPVEPLSQTLPAEPIATNLHEVTSQHGSHSPVPTSPGAPPGAMCVVRRPMQQLHKNSMSPGAKPHMGASHSGGMLLTSPKQVSTSPRSRRGATPLSQSGRGGHPGVMQAEPVAMPPGPPADGLSTTLPSSLQVPVRRQMKPMMPRMEVSRR